MYGSELFNLESKDIANLSTAWRVCCRRTAKLNNRTHSNYLHSIFGTNNLYDILVQRTMNFIINGINHDNSVVNVIFRNSFYQYSSILSRNLSVVSNYNRISRNRIYIKNKFKIKSEEHIESWRLNIINEIIGLLDGFNKCNIDSYILKTILEFLCTE